MTENQPLLTADELAALSAAIDDGSLPVDTGYNIEVNVRKHDLTSEDSSLGINVMSLDMINERFIRLFRLGMLEVLRTSPRINPTRAQIVRFGDYIKDLRAPLSVNIVRMAPLRGYAMVVIEPTVVFSSLDSFFWRLWPGRWPVASRPAVHPDRVAHHQDHPAGVLPLTQGSMGPDHAGGFRACQL